MEELKNLLTNPLKDTDKVISLVEIQNKFRQIAQKIFNDYSIKCGDKTFRLAEIEFYYYKKGVWESEWNTTTYYREEKDAGKLFFHYSGVDICFQSDKNEFGGILIRSLIEVDNNGKYMALHTGPLFCANLMLNSCEKELPIIKNDHSLDYDDKTIKSDLRFGVNKEAQEFEKEMNMELCFFVTQYQYNDNNTPLNWQEASETDVWNYKTGDLIRKKRYYNRFKNKKS